MDNRVLFLLVLFCCGVTLTGCSSSADKPNLVEGPCQGRTSVPLWVCGGHQEADRYVAVGSAPLSKLGYHFTRKEALANARAALAEQIQVAVKSKVESYQRSIDAEAEVAERVVTQVNRQVSEMVLRDTQQISYWEDLEQKTVHLLIGMSKDLVDRAIDQYLDQSDTAATALQHKNAGLSAAAKLR